MAPIILAYYTNWCCYPPREYTPDKIPVELLTHINYAFAKIVDGKIASTDPWSDFEKPYALMNQDGTPTGTFKGAIAALNDPTSPLRRRNPNLKTLISVGGWTESKYFSLVARTSESRALFTKSVCDYLEKTDFDGVDLDWEFPVAGGLPENERHPVDKVNFTLLLECLRAALDAQADHLGKPKYLLTVATAARASQWVNLDIPGLARTCDFINLMTYDGSGPWSSHTDHHAPLSMINETVQAYVKLGAPASKLVVGLPFYGRSFAGATAHGQPHNGPGLGTHEPGVVDFDHLHTLLGQGFTCQEHDETPAYVSTDAWITGESELSMQRKGELARNLGVAGLMCWELSMNRDGRLWRAAHRGFGLSDQS